MQKVLPRNAVLIPKDAHCVFSGILFEVFQWEQLLFDGSNAVFEMLRRPDSVRVIAVVDGMVLFQDEHQPNHPGNITFPGGKVDEGETPLQAAQRELLEEAGYELSRWRLINVAQPESKIEYFIYTYIAWGHAVSKGPSRDSGEKITVRKEPYAKVRRMAEDGVGYIAHARDSILPAITLQELCDTAEYEGISLER